MGNVGIKRAVGLIVLAVFILTSVVPPSYAQSLLQLPAVDQMVALSPAFNPAVLKGIKVYPQDPLRLDFILANGEASGNGAGHALQGEASRLIKYFLASLTIPEKDLWVNLSPYEKDRIVPEAFGQTEMGRDLLAQDYMLKQITASVIYPEGEVGKVFWSRVYVEAQKRYGTTDIPVDTLNKVWIVPEKATVYETKEAAFVAESRLKVMMEEDYLALEKNNEGINQTAPATNKLGSDIVREVVIPILEKEVNEGKNFTLLRQVYNALILATWYKRKVREGLLGQAYVDRHKIVGIDIADKDEKEKIWQRYVEAFKKGAYNYIKEVQDAVTGEVIPRKYFSGGMGLQVGARFLALPATPAMVQGNFRVDRAMVVQVQADMAMSPVPGADRPMTPPKAESTDAAENDQEIKIDKDAVMFWHHIFGKDFVQDHWNDFVRISKIERFDFGLPEEMPDFFKKDSRNWDSFVEVIMASDQDATLTNYALSKFYEKYHDKSWFEKAWRGLCGLAILQMSQKKEFKSVSISKLLDKEFSEFVQIFTEDSLFGNEGYWDNVVQLCIKAKLKLESISQMIKWKYSLGISVEIEQKKQLISDLFRAGNEYFDAFLTLYGIRDFWNEDQYEPSRKFLFNNEVPLAERMAEMSRRIFVKKGEAYFLYNLVDSNKIDSGIEIPPSEMTTDKLVDYLGSSDERIRVKAATELLKMDEVSVRDALLRSGLWVAKGSDDQGWKRLLEAFRGLYVSRQLPSDRWQDEFEDYEGERFVALGMEMMTRPYKNSTHFSREGDLFEKHLSDMRDRQAFISFIATSQARAFSTRRILEIAADKTHNDIFKGIIAGILTLRNDLPIEGVQLLTAWLKPTAGYIYSGTRQAIERALMSADGEMVYDFYLQEDQKSGLAKRAMDMRDGLMGSSVKLKNDISIMITSRCQFNCPMCIARALRGEKHPDVPRKDLFSWIDQVKGVAQIRLVGPGETMDYGKENIQEPGLSQDFIELVQYAARSADEVYVVTNGALIPDNIDKAREMFRGFPKNVVWVLSVDNQHATQMRMVQGGKKLSDVSNILEQLHQEGAIKAGYYVVDSYDNYERNIEKQFGLETAAIERRVTIFPEVQPVDKKTKTKTAEDRTPEHLKAHSLETDKTDLYIDMDGFVIGSNHVAFIPPVERQSLDPVNIFGNINEMPLARILLEKYQDKILAHQYAEHPEAAILQRALLKAVSASLRGDRQTLNQTLRALRSMSGYSFEQYLEWSIYHSELKTKVLVAAWFRKYLPTVWEAIISYKPSRWKTFGNLTRLVFTNVGNNSDEARWKEDYAQAPALDGSAMAIDSAQNGGIDLTPQRMELQTTGSGDGIKFNLDPAQLQQLQNAPGLTPVIIDIQPMTTTVLMFLGFKADAPAGQLSRR
ncbi:MAG: hypothetical protein HQL20_04970 [Candidatus Omnitrophica bacterium]|nr:hypothetical protein [Candidatus Omnitrophota bacterium]